jgi:hypothetical protein
MRNPAPSRTSGSGGPSAEIGVAPGDAREARTAVAGNGDIVTSRDGAALFRCAECGAERAARRIPPGWKRTDEHVTCGPCYRTRWTLRCVSVPVSNVEEGFWAEMRAGWKAARRAANRCVRMLYLDDDWGDSVDTPKLPKFPADPSAEQRRYHALRAWAPEYTTVSLCALMNWVRKTYLKRRFDLWIGKASLPTFRTVPWMVRKSGWTPDPIGGSVTITCYQGRRTLDLSASADFAPQRRLLTYAASGEYLRGDAMLCEQGKRIMFRAAVWVPVQARGGATGTLTVSSDPKALVTFKIGDRRALKPLHMSHLRRSIAAHDEWRQGAAEDTKHEKRWPSHVRRDMLAALDRRCGRENNRLRTGCQQIAAMIVGYAVRQNLAEIACDFADRGYVPHFPWSQLRASIASAAELRGIRVRDSRKRDVTTGSTRPVRKSPVVRDSRKRDVTTALTVHGRQRGEGARQ